MTISLVVLLAACGKVKGGAVEPESGGGAGGEWAEPSGGTGSEAMASAGGASSPPSWGTGGVRAEPDAAHSCVGISFSDEAIAVDPYIVLDASAAMNDPVAPGRTETWWTEVGSALQSASTSEHVYGGVALQFFPLAAALPGACGPGYEEPAVPFTAFGEFGSAAAMATAMRVPLGRNTAGPALAAAYAFLESRERHRLGGEYSVVLVTRGAPEACDPLELVPLVRKGTEMEPPTRTHVVLLGSSPHQALLDAVAAAGGTERALVVAPSDVASGILEAVLRAQVGVGPCRYDPPPGASWSGVDRASLRLHSGEDIDLPRVSGRAECGEAGGFYDDSGALALCPASCLMKAQGKIVLYDCD